MLDDRPMHTLPWQEQWELLKMERAVKQWNDTHGIALDDIKEPNRKAAGRPSYEIERERGIVT